MWKKLTWTWWGPQDCGKGCTWHPWKNCVIFWTSGKKKNKRLNCKNLDASLTSNELEWAEWQHGKSVTFIATRVIWEPAAAFRVLSTLKQLEQNAELCALGCLDLIESWNAPLTLLISLSRNDVLEESTTITNFTLEFVTYPYLVHQLRTFYWWV